MGSRFARLLGRTKPDEKETNIGSILLRLGFINGDQLRCAIETKLRSSAEVLIGEILVAQGAVTRWQLQHALTEQQARRGVQVDYAEQIKVIMADAHAGAQSVQDTLDDLKCVALDFIKNPPKLLTLKDGKK